MIERDLKRNAYCLLGLPFDMITTSETAEAIYYFTTNKKRCFLSTPNTNFLIASQTDTGFRDSVVNSNLSIADGKPIVWLSRLLDIPVPERVAGSDLIVALIDNKNSHKPLKVFFFGGEEGVASKACSVLNKKNSGLICTGSMNPGFVSVDEMSTITIINKINEKNVDFIVVSLGAKKGQAWIQKNIEKIHAPVVSHLGAVVNFIAGTISRSPVLLRKLGLEWLWRIKEEPTLWRRYLSDGFSLLGLILFKVIPLAFIIYRYRQKYGKNLEVQLSKNADTFHMNLKGFLGVENSNKINIAYKEAVTSLRNVEITINKGSYMDASFMAKLQFLHKAILNNGYNLTVTTESTLVKKIFHYNCCKYLLNSSKDKMA